MIFESWSFWMVFKSETNIGNFSKVWILPQVTSLGWHSSSRLNLFFRKLKMLGPVWSTDAKIRGGMFFSFFEKCFKKSLIAHQCPFIWANRRPNNPYMGIGQMKMDFVWAQSCHIPLERYFHICPSCHSTKSPFLTGRTASSVLFWMLKRTQAFEA